METLGYMVFEAASPSGVVINNVMTSARRLLDTNETPWTYSRGDNDACQAFLSHGIGSSDVCNQWKQRSQANKANNFTSSPEQSSSLFSP
jgi:hypothetical protein